MKFSKTEEKARAFVLSAGSEVTLEQVWESVGKEHKGCWRTKAAELMRRVCLKSQLKGPLIERSSRLGRGSKAKYRKQPEAGKGAPE